MVHGSEQSNTCNSCLRKYLWELLFSLFKEILLMWGLLFSDPVFQINEVTENLWVGHVVGAAKTEYTFHLIVGLMLNKDYCCLSVFPIHLLYGHKLTKVRIVSSGKSIGVVCSAGPWDKHFGCFNWDLYTHAEVCTSVLVIHVATWNQFSCLMVFVKNQRSSFRISTSEEWTNLFYKSKLLI